MRARFFALLLGFGACGSSIAALGACASDNVLMFYADGEADGADGDASDGGVDSGAEEADACSSDDCVYFPAICSGDVLCPNGPFDPTTGGGAFDLRTQINVIRGRSVSDVWAVGALGAIAHFDGTSWRRSDPGTRDSIRGIWLRGEAEIALTTLDKVYSRGLPVPDGGAAPSSDGWTDHALLSAPDDFAPNTFQSAWAAPGAEWLWAAVRANWRQNGLWRLHVSSSTNAFEIGHAIPSNTCKTLPCDEMLAVHGTSPDDLWAVGLMGAVIRVTGADGDAPKATAFNAQTLNALRGVWAVSSTEAWLVGANGVIRRYTGDPVLWDVVRDIPTTANLNAVWGSSASDVWAVGDEAVVLHWDGARWSRVKIAGLGERRPKLTAVWMPEPGHVWIGGQGVVLSLGGKP